MPPLLLATLLTAIAGWMDATGFILVSHVFVSFMSGNSTQLMIAISQGQLHDIGVLGLTIVSFVGGIVLGDCLYRASHIRGSLMVFSSEALLLWLAAFIVFLHGSKLLFLPCMAVAMGMHNTAVQGKQTLLVKTYISGTLVSLGLGIAASLRGETMRAMFSPLVIWLGFAMGAIGGAWVSLNISALMAIIYPALLLSLIAVLARIFPADPLPTDSDR